MSEYELLRQEILAWQERRFTVLTGSLTLVVAIMGFVLVDKRQRRSRDEVVALVFFLLGIAATFTWYAGWSNAITGAFLEVFHEGKGREFIWQTARTKLIARRSIVGWLNVNVFFAMIYAAVGLACYGLARTHCTAPREPAMRRMAVVATIFFVGSLGLAAFMSTPSHTYRWEWRRVRRHLQATDTGARGAASSAPAATAAPQR